MTLTLPGIDVFEGPAPGAVTIRELAGPVKQDWAARFAAALAKSGADRVQLEHYKLNERACFIRFAAYARGEVVSAQVVRDF